MEISFAERNCTPNLQKNIKSVINISQLSSLNNSSKLDVNLYEPKSIKI